MGRVFFDTRKHIHEITATTTTYQCLDSDSNKTFILNTAAATVITLPADADIEIGWNIDVKMILANNLSTAINCSDATNTTGQMFIGGLHFTVAADATADIFQGYAVTAANDSQILLDSNLANNQATVGTDLNIMKTATNRFLVTGTVVGTAAGTGAAIFVDI
mgnify:CR=1 FL=1